MIKAIDFESSDDSRSPPSRLFSLSMPFGRRKPEPEHAASKMALAQIKLQVELSFQDIEGIEAIRLRLKITASRDVQDLWLLRSDIYQLIARRLNQQVAAQRINALLPCFEQWLPARALTKI